MKKFYFNLFLVYAFTAAQFAALGVAHAAEAENKLKLNRKIKFAEFSFACKILSHRTSTTLSMGEFILLEFMRMGCIEAEEIESIRAKFVEMDKLCKGELSLNDLHQIGEVLIDKHSLRAGISPSDLAALSASSYMQDGKRKSSLAKKNKASRNINEMACIKNDKSSKSCSVGSSKDQHNHHFEVDVENSLNEL